MNKITKSLTCTSIFLIFSTFTITAKAAVFKCVSVSGATYYTDKPCAVGNKETEIKAQIVPENQPEVDDNEETEIYEG